MRGGLEGGGAGGFRGLLTQGRASPCPQVGQDAAPPPSSPLGSDGRGDLERSLPQAKSSRAGSPRPAAPPGGPWPPDAFVRPAFPGALGPVWEGLAQDPGAEPGNPVPEAEPGMCPLSPGLSHGSRLTAVTRFREAQRRGFPRRNEGERRVSVTVAVRVGDRGPVRGDPPSRSVWGR